MAKDFDADIGVPYELPDNAPKQGEYEEFTYYQHPAGIYLGFVGKLTSKFKDAKGKSCDPQLPGAVFDHFQLPLWITTFLGSSTAPKKEEIIRLTPEGLIIPSDRTTFELYYGLYISIDPKRMWSYAKTFEGWVIPGHTKYNIIQQSGKNKATKVMNYSAFPGYYGLPCKFALTYKPESERQTRYVDGKLELGELVKRIPSDMMNAFETAIDAKVKSEQAERNAKKDTYEPETPPETNFDLLGSDNVDDDLDGFIK